MSKSLDECDFDTWVALAKTDPEAFEHARQEAIKRAIEAGDDQQRLKQLQWRIDAERQRAHTPYQACLKISNAMWNSLTQLSKSFEDLLEMYSLPFSQSNFCGTNVVGLREYREDKNALCTPKRALSCGSPKEQVSAKVLVLPVK